MTQIVSDFFKEIITNFKNLEILIKIVRNVNDKSLLDSLSANISRLTYEDKRLIANTYNALSLIENPVMESERKEQDDLIRLLNIFTELLLYANQMQKDNLEDVFSKLNPKQQLASIVKDGPMLLSAGPGSGKTRTTTFKIAVLMNVYDVNPNEILAVTFTNKGAGEMVGRIKNLVGKKAEQLNMGTFHAICQRFLRQHIELLNNGHNVNFSVAKDQASVISKVLKEMQLLKQVDLREVKNFIGSCKNALLTPDDVVHNLNIHHLFPRIYEEYQNYLRTNNLIDYDDMIMYTVNILEQDEDIRKAYARLYRYIHIDEYQDTNIAQYRLTKILTTLHRNVTVVGDPDQSIYRFRGADITNILNFINDYSDCISINLDTNYRSTKNIVEASAALISNNKERIDKPIRPAQGKEEGDKIEVHTFFDDKQESSFISSEIKRLMQEFGYKYQDFMILYRNNSLSRAVEESFIRTGIPHVITKGNGFYDREEIQDLMAYMELAINLQNGEAFDRIYNVPARKISDSVYSIIQDLARKTKMCVFQASLQINKINTAHYNNQQIPPQYQPFVLNQNQFQAVNQFLIFIKGLYESSKTSTAYDTLKYIIDTTNYRNYIRHKYKTDLNKQIEKLANVDELLHAAIEYKDNHTIQKDTASEFVSYVSFLNDASSKAVVNFPNMTTLNDCTFNMVSEEDSVSFFGRNSEQQSGMYSFNISKTVIRNFVPKIIECIEHFKADKSYVTTFSELFLQTKRDSIELSYQNEHQFIFNLEQFEEVSKYLETLIEEHTVSLMTEHSAKGLERKVVFIIGCDQGTSPSIINGDISNIEEERRLFYVGMTRAEEKLYLSRCQKKFVHGKSHVTRPSQFISEIPKQYLVFKEH